MAINGYGPFESDIAAQELETAIALHAAFLKRELLVADCDVRTGDISAIGAQAEIVSLLARKAGHACFSQTEAEEWLARGLHLFDKMAEGVIFREDGDRAEWKARFAQTLGQLVEFADEETTDWQAELLRRWKWQPPAPPKPEMPSDHKELTRLADEIISGERGDQVRALQRLKRLLPNLKQVPLEELLPGVLRLANARPAIYALRKERKLLVSGMTRALSALLWLCNTPDADQLLIDAMTEKWSDRGFALLAARRRFDPEAILSRFAFFYRKAGHAWMNSATSCDLTGITGHAPEDPRFIECALAAAMEAEDAEGVAALAQAGDGKAAALLMQASRTRGDMSYDSDAMRLCPDTCVRIAAEWLAEGGPSRVIIDVFANAPKRLYPEIRPSVIKLLDACSPKIAAQNSMALARLELIRDGMFG